MAHGLDVFEAAKKRIMIRREKRSKTATLPDKQNNQAVCKERGVLTTANKTGKKEVKSDIAATVMKVAESGFRKGVEENVHEQNVHEHSRQTIRRQKLLRLFRNNPKTTAEAASIIFRCKKKTIYRDIEALKQSGQLCRVGSDSTGSWLVIDKK